MAKPGDFVVFLGAGNITQWAYALPRELAAATGRCMTRGEALLARLGDRLAGLRGRITPECGDGQDHLVPRRRHRPRRCSSRPTRTISPPS